MKRTFFASLSFAGVALLVVVVLWVSNLIPGAIDRGLMRPYASVEEASASLGLRDIRLPAYFPADMVWPPSAVLGQLKPYPAVITEFRSASQGGLLLTIVQTGSRDLLRDRRFALARTTEKRTLSFKNRAAQLEVGTCDRNEPCCHLLWEEERYTFFLLMRSVPAELLRTAESMAR